MCFKLKMSCGDCVASVFQGCGCALCAPLGRLRARGGSFGGVLDSDGEVRAEEEMGGNNATKRLGNNIYQDIYAFLFVVTMVDLGLEIS